MALVPASFPGELWDGLSDNPFRTSRTDNLDPDPRDWDRVAAEVIAVQNQLGVAAEITVPEEGEGTGMEEVDEIQVVLQLTNSDGTAVTTQPVIDVYLSDDPAGEGVAAAGATSETFDEGVALLTVTAHKQWKAQASAEGRVTITFAETGALEVYMAAILPNGKLVVSTVLTFVDNT